MISSSSQRGSWVRKAILGLLVFASATVAIDDAAHDACTSELLLNSKHLGNATLAGCGSIFELVKSPEETPSVNDHATGLARRQCMANVYVYREHELLGTGIWWGPWEKVSDCAFCELSAGICTRGLEWSHSTTRTFSVGFGIDSINYLTEAIGANPSLNFGYSWSETVSEGGSFTCQVPPGARSSIWAQQKMGWSDSQSREVSVTTDTRCLRTYKRGDWLGVGRADWPLKGANNRQLGCSSGAAAEC